MSANIIGADGIHIEALTDTINSIVSGTTGIPGLQQIYGSDINVQSNSPDGQLINIFALAKQDILNLIVQDYNAKDPDQAVGTALDGVCQLCNLTRKGGTYTQVNLTVTTSSNLNLNGQDTSTPFTVQDAAGNQYQLISSASLTTGANTLLFQAVNIGNVQVQLNTITVPVTIVAGVVSINNPTSPTVVGTDQETDAQLRIRRQNSVGKPGQGFNQSLLGGLYSVPNLTGAVVLENQTSSTDVNGIPPNSIWVITQGGTVGDIGAQIYKYRNAGCGMKGSTSSTITQVDGSLFTVLYDAAIGDPLYIQLHLTSLTGGSIDQNAIKTGLTSALVYQIYQAADITSIDTIIHSINPNVVASSLGVSGTITGYVSSTLPSGRNHYWVSSTTRISIV
jgi:Baseplate J-like protein